MAVGAEPPMDIETYKAMWISKGYRLIELGTPYPEHIISKSLFIEVWDAIRKNNHEELIRLKAENPDLIIYSKAKFGYPPEPLDVDEDFGDLPYLVIRQKGYVSLLDVFSSQTIKKSCAGGGTWKTNYETHKLLFDLGLIERNDPRIIFELLHREYLLKEKEAAYEILSSFMDLEAIRKTFFFYFPSIRSGGQEFEFYSWKVLIAKKYCNYLYKIPKKGRVNFELLHEVFRRNAIVQMLEHLLLKGSDFIGYENFVLQKPDGEYDDADDDDDEDEHEDDEEDDEDEHEEHDEEDDEHQEDVGEGEDGNVDYILDDNDDDDDDEDEGDADYADFDLDDDEEVEVRNDDYLNK